MSYVPCMLSERNKRSLHNFYVETLNFTDDRSTKPLTIMTKRRLPSSFVKSTRCFLLLLMTSLVTSVLFLTYAKTSIVTADSELVLHCRDVLRRMTRGRWIQHEMTNTQEYEMKMFHMKVRVEHGVPPGLQRPDDKCGNVTLGPLMNPWYRALCDAEGRAPCCYDNVCVSKPKEECACPNCYDMRRTIHAEHATWRPAEESCEVQNLTVQQMCSVLDNATIYFIGDSLVRHVYTAFLLAIREDELTGGYLPMAPPGYLSITAAACPSMYMFAEKLCRHRLDTDTLVCKGRVRIKYFEYKYIKQAQDIHSTILELRNASRGLVFFGTGIHDNFKANETQKEILLPLLQKMKSLNITSPKIVWAATHAPGLMKTPMLPEQSYENVLKYNAKLREFMKDWNVPVFDTFNMTDGLMSFDGVHYGLGANRVKVRVFLNYLLERYLNHEW